jgi:hypothetical protein
MAGKKSSMKRSRSARRKVRGGLGGYNYCRNNTTGAYSKSFTGICSTGNKRYECTKEVTNFIDDNIANDKTGNCTNRDLVQSASNASPRLPANAPWAAPAVAAATYAANAASAAANRVKANGVNYCRDNVGGYYSKSVTGMCTPDKKRYFCKNAVTTLTDANIANDKTNCQRGDLGKSAWAAMEEFGDKHFGKGGRKSTRKMRRGRGKKTRRY